MPTRTAALVLPALWAAVALQALALNWLPMPLAAICPAAVAAICLAMVLGPVPGALIGAWTGLAMDLLPPAGGPLGAWALILAVVCAGVGRVSAARAPGPWESLALVAVGSGAVVVARAGALWFAGTTPPLAITLPVVAGATLGGLLLAPLMLPVALMVCGREPLRVRRRRRRDRLPGTAGVAA